MCQPPAKLQQQGAQAFFLFLLPGSSGTLAGESIGIEHRLSSGQKLPADLTDKFRAAFKQGAVFVLVAKHPPGIPFRQTHGAGTDAFSGGAGKQDLPHQSGALLFGKGDEGRDPVLPGVKGGVIVIAYAVGTAARCPGNGFKGGAQGEPGSFGLPHLLGEQFVFPAVPAAAGLPVKVVFHIKLLSLHIRYAYSSGPEYRLVYYCMHLSGQKDKMTRNFHKKVLDSLTSR